MMRRPALPSVVVAAAVLVLATGTASRARLADVLGSRDLRPFATALGESIARSLPTVAASGGVSYEFDYELGTPVRSAGLLGQLFLERAEPLGAKRWSLSASYQRIAIESIDGTDLSELRDLRAIVGTHGRGSLTIPHMAIDATTDQGTLSATYGVTDDVDVNLTVPLLGSDLSVDGRIAPSAGHGKPFDASAARFGLGDVLVRAKYRAVRWAGVTVAGGLSLRLPSGSEDDFQGTGAAEVEPTLIVSGPKLAPVAAIELQPYANASVALDTDAVGDSRVRWGIGVDARLRGRVALAVAVLARHDFEGIDARPVARKSGPPAPLFGVRFDRADVYDVSIGGRVAVWKDAVLLFANVLVPLNDDGARASAIPLVGVEIVP